VLPELDEALSLTWASVQIVDAIVCHAAEFARKAGSANPRSSSRQGLGQKLKR